MLFNSFSFLLFALIFFLIWPWVRKQNTTRWLFLSFASFFFYGWFDWRFLPLLIVIGFIDYLGALGIVRFPKAKLFFLCLSLGINLSTLSLFKYLGFFAANLNWLLSLSGKPQHFEPLALILPLGISFYTFESLSYVVDAYKGEIESTKNLLHYFAFLSLFPHLIAGPIIRPQELLPQLKIWKPISESERWEGTKLIAFGLFKKVVLADNIAPSVNEAFAGHTVQSEPFFWWMAIILFAFQIYYDFSGYSDIARGLARWMGYNFPLNFNHPYLATSFRNFWGRWHISLSSWFRDYVYIPLGGSRKGISKGLMLMAITMIVSGFWHGAAWTFICWGALHALFLAIERLTNWEASLSKIPWGRHLVVFLIFVQVCLAWVFFRATSLSQALAICGQLFNVSNAFSISPIRQLHPFELASYYLLGALLIELSVYWGAFTWMRRQRWYYFAEIVTVIALFVVSVYGRGPGGAFIYFQF